MAAGESPDPVQQNTITAEHLAYLSQTAMEFVSLPVDADIYRHIAVRLKELLGDAIVVVGSYDSRTREICQEAVAGGGSVVDAASKMTGIRLRKYHRVVNEKSEKLLHLGRLVKLEAGLYEMLMGDVPRVVTRAVEQMARVREIYGMGCVAGGECFGNVVLILRSRARPFPAPVVETYINQAAVALQKRRAEIALRKSEERYRTLMDLAADPYLVTTDQIMIADANQCACRALGYRREQLVGRSLAEFMDADELAGDPLPWELVRRRESFSQTRRFRLADGSYGVFEAHIAPLPDGQFLVTGRDITERRRLEKEVVDASRRERESLGRDLHDSLGQQLSGIGFLCTALEKRMSAQRLPEAADAARIAGLVTDSVKQTRRIAQGLCPVEMTSEGLADSLERLAGHFSETYGVCCRVAFMGSGVMPGDAAASHLYLMAQEAATNAVRHGRARTILIELNTGDSRGRLRIRDDGSGFVGTPDPSRGLGLRTMRYRAEMIDGVLDVQSGSDGTTVTCSFPQPAADS